MGNHFQRGLSAAQSLKQISVRNSARTTVSFVTEYSRVHQALIGLTLFVLLNNALMVHAANTTPDIPSEVISDPYQFADTVRLLADYTPNLEEDPDAIAITLEERVSGEFIKTNPLIATLPSDSEATPSPTQIASAETRSKDIKYTVQIGDTLSGIGSKFSLKMATIQVKNNITNVNSLKPGLELLIPAQDLSDKAIKAADDRKLASAQLASSQTAGRRIIATAKAGGYGLVIPIRHNGISRGLVGGHTGIDYRANIGTPVVAAASGTVAVADESGWNGGYGRTALLSHSNGMTTRYGHMNDVIVRGGQHVEQGQVIGYSGNTGRSTGPHLHFELRVNGAARNPF
jgi:LysM repeat protein